MRIGEKELSQESKVDSGHQVGSREKDLPLLKKELLTGEVE